MKTFLESLPVTVLFLSMLAAAVAAEAQQVAKVSRVGMLLPVSPAVAAHNTEAFRQGLRERGYVEGENIDIECRFADGRIEPLGTLAGLWLARLKMDAHRDMGNACGARRLGRPWARDPHRQWGLLRWLSGGYGCWLLEPRLARWLHHVGVTVARLSSVEKLLQRVKKVVLKTPRRATAPWKPERPALVAMFDAVKGAGGLL